MRIVALALALCVAGSVAAPADPRVPEPAGYRTDDYRAPVPDSVAGGRVVHTDAVKTMVDKGEAVLVDVLPAPRRPEGMKAGAPWMPTSHDDIPGSVWLPEVGRGALGPALDERFRRRLDELTGGDRNKPLVFYCLPQCWMSWNATKRAASYGYRNAIWYPDGSDGWQAAGLPLQQAWPEPVQ